MPTVTQSPVKAYAHCRDARCPGYSQQEVDAVREETAYTFGDLGGDGVFMGMVERSSVAFKFAEDADIECPACGHEREVSGSARPSYQALSGHDPLGLLNSATFDASSVGVPDHVLAPPVEETDEQIEARLRAKLREEQIEARLRKELGDA